MCGLTDSKVAKMAHFRTASCDAESIGVTRLTAGIAVVDANLLTCSPLGHFDDIAGNLPEMTRDGLCTPLGKSHRLPIVTIVVTNSKQ